MGNGIPSPLERAQLDQRMAQVGEALDHLVKGGVRLLDAGIDPAEAASQMRRLLDLAHQKRPFLGQDDSNDVLAGAIMRLAAGKGGTL